MAIVIPSKHIHGSPENPKVFDNLFNGGTFQTTKFISRQEESEREYEETFADFSGGFEPDYADNSNNAKYDKVERYGSILAQVFSYTDYVTQYFRVDDGGIVAKRLQGEKSLESLGEIKVSVFGVKKSGNCFVRYTLGNSFPEIEPFGEIEETEEEIVAPENGSKISITDEKQYEQSAEDWRTLSVTSETTINNFQNIDTAYFEYDEEQDAYVLKTENEILRIFAGYKKITAGGVLYSSGDEITSGGVYEEFEPYRITITANGTIFSLEKEEITHTGDKSLNMGGNELMQRQVLATSLSNKIRSQYKDGKETATLTCSVVDYFSESGEKVIGVENDNLPMFFEFGDEVIPYLMNSLGEEEPLSLNEVGNPKVFVVVGKSLTDGGILRQQLNLLEK